MVIKTIAEQQKLRCTFEKDGCPLENDPDSDERWVEVTGRESGTNIVDHTLATKGALNKL